MNNSLNIIIKGAIIFKVILSILFAISFLMVASDLWAVRNQIEGRELVQDDPKKLYSLLATLLATITTLLFDIRVIKLKDKLLLKHWVRLTLLTILVVAVGVYFKIQWLGISLMLLVSFYATLLLFKYSTTEK
ncbi:MAG: hypothetical protein ACOVOQ_03420 [Flavobacterium sp.]